MGAFCVATGGSHDMRLITGTSPSGSAGGRWTANACERTAQELSAEGSISVGHRGVGADSVPPMAHPRRFRFGLQVSNATGGDDWAALARKIEDLGFSTLFMPDHFNDQLAPVPALMAAADATTDLRVGALVFDNDYKHPVVLAKEMATIDILSGGRLELGLGAGLDGDRLRTVGHPPRHPRRRASTGWSRAWRS